MSLPVSLIFIRSIAGSIVADASPPDQTWHAYLPWIVSGAIILLGLVVYGWSDLVRTHWRRIWAISSVCVTESLRRRVLWVTPLAILATVVVSLFVKGNDEQDTIRQITKYCLFTSAMLITMIAVILAATNLPREIENRVIFTIVTKPTTRLEIVLGKVLGFARVSALILIIMGLFTVLYLQIRARPLLADLRSRLDRPNGQDALASNSPERITDEYYLHSGLLGTRSLDWPEDPVQVFGRPPEGNEYWMMGGESLYTLLGFELTPDQAANFVEYAQHGVEQNIEMRFNVSLDVDQSRPPNRHEMQQMTDLNVNAPFPWQPQVQVRYLDAGNIPLVPINRIDPGAVVKLRGQPGKPYSGSVPVPGAVLEKAAAKGRFIAQVTARTPATLFGVGANAAWFSFTIPTNIQYQAQQPGVPQLITISPPASGPPTGNLSPPPGKYALYVDDGAAPLGGVTLAPGDQFGFQEHDGKIEGVCITTIDLADARTGTVNHTRVTRPLPLERGPTSTYAWKYVLAEVPMVANPTGGAPGIFGAHPGKKGQSLASVRRIVPRHLLWSTLPFPFAFLDKQDVQGPVAVFRFRNVKVSPGSDGKVGLQLTPYIERTGEAGGSDDAEGIIEVINRKTGESSGQLPPFRTENSQTSPILVDAKYTDGGDFDVLLRNITVGQNLGVEGGQGGAVAVVAADRSFIINLVKSLFILWLLSLLVVIIAVFCSTFVSWPIAVVLTMVILLAHWGVDQLGDALSPGIAGRQTLQVFGVRNPTESFLISNSIDKLALVLRNISNFLPDVAKFPVTEDIERGVSIPPATIFGAMGVIFCYGFPMLVFSYVILRRKEVAP